MNPKLYAGIKKAGATVEEAVSVAKEVVEKAIRNTDKVFKIPEITAAELSKMVVEELRKCNETAAEEYVKFRDNKLRNKGKKIEIVIALEKNNYFVILCNF